MKELKWNDRFNIGVKVVDRAHQRLFSIVGKLISLNEDPDKQQHACREGIKYFKNYACKHFAEEEAYMKSIHYDKYELHRRLHDDMRDETLPALEAELEAQDYSAAAVHHFLGFCIGWLTSHIMIEDFAISRRAPARWVHQPSEDEMASLEKAAIQTFSDLYHITPYTVSRLYSGEAFSSGAVLCYRLTYIFSSGKKQRIFLLYEEQMVLGTLSEMIGKTIKRVDKTVVYTMKFLSQKFIDCMSSHFNPPEEEHKLEKIDMLTFEQFQNTFEREYLLYSMLFSTGENGYFGLCIR